MTGRVCSRPHTRHSPAGIPIARFTLEHDSIQVEADRPRQARMRIAVAAAGEGLQSAVRQLSEGAGVQVAGFLASAGYRSGEYRLVLHAKRIELLNESTNERED